MKIKIMSAVEKKMFNTSSMLYKMCGVVKPFGASDVKQISRRVL
ncbi:MAG: hypothetical protein ABII75_05550 [Candidatus Omnitrophota bacterium]